jgi:hypothetical protein
MGGNMNNIMSHAGLNAIAKIDRRMNNTIRQIKFDYNKGNANTQRNIIMFLVDLTMDCIEQDYCADILNNYLKTLFDEIRKYEAKGI